ncbi:MAG: DnaJ domain-containing protein [Candidatus Saccharibacteria bacterium]
MTESSKFVDYYALLEVQTDAEPREIRLAFIRLAKQHHPDVGGSTADMQQFNTAYETLMSPEHRKAYDMLYDFETGKAAVHYREDGTHKASSVDDMSDEEIDYFINSIFQEFHTQPKPKQTIWAKLRRMV